MTNLTEITNGAINRAQKNYPGGGIYWDMGEIQQNMIFEMKELLKALAKKIKEENNLTYDEETLINENYTL